MIGYNIKEINELLEEIEKSYKDIKKVMEEPWEPLTRTLRTEWVGPDEVANEQVLANALIKLYASVKGHVHTVASNIRNLGENWKTWQTGNVVTGGDKVEVGSKVGNIDEVKVSDEELKIKSKDENFDEKTNLGLKDSSSAAKVGAAIDEYTKTVYNQVKDLYSKLDSKAAFLGGQQAANINKYVHEAGAAIGEFTNAVKSLKESLQNAAKAYNEQSTNIANSAAGAKVDINYN